MFSIPHINTLISFHSIALYIRSIFASESAVALDMVDNAEIFAAIRRFVVFDRDVFRSRFTVAESLDDPGS